MVLLVLVGRRATATRAVLTFVGTVLVGLVAVPGASAYWGGRLVDPTRVGPPSLAHNQSVSGVLTRLLDEPPSTLLWMAVAGPIAIATVVLGAVWWRRGDRVLGACLGALAMLLASPVSWSHHWVWAVPIALALWPRSRIAAAAVGRGVRGPADPLATVGAEAGVRLAMVRAPVRECVRARRGGAGGVVGVGGFEGRCAATSTTDIRNG